MTLKETKLYHAFIKIDALPKSINQTGRLHWAVKTKITNEWQTLVALAVGNRKPERPLEFARLIYTRYGSVALDYDNLVNSYKAVQDGLVKAGILVDDKVKNIAYPEFYFVKVPRKDSHITIEVFELQAQPEIKNPRAPKFR